MLFGQIGFTLPVGIKKEIIPFQLVNNLPVITVNINGKILSFILDSGVNSSIYFSLNASDTLDFKNTSPVLLRGLGPEAGISAVRSTNNTITVGNAIDRNHALFIVFDMNLNFSPRMGIPIHGILGNDFFRNFVVSIDYKAEKITIYTSQNFDARKKLRRSIEFPLQFSSGKPYLNLKVFGENKWEEVTLLVDSGSSDVIWLFNRSGFILDAPLNYFEDFLGLGLSGNIFGKRMQIDSLTLGSFKLKKVNVAFPDEEAIAVARNFQARDGSIGGGFLSRFTVTFDYSNKRIFFKKNKNFRKPFNYNMSGLTLEHQGLELMIKKNLAENQVFSETSTKKIETSTMQISLIPKYIVVDVRPNSPAAEAGINIGDALMSINGKPSYEFKLYEILDMFSKEEGKKMTLEIERNDEIYKIKFFLKNPIP